MWREDRPGGGSHHRFEVFDGRVHVGEYEGEQFVGQQLPLALERQVEEVGVERELGVVALVVGADLGVSVGVGRLVAQGHPPVAKATARENVVDPGGKVAVAAGQKAGSEGSRRDRAATSEGRRRRHHHARRGGSRTRCAKELTPQTVPTA